MKVKITKTQLKQLIKEEANRYKKVLELQARKEELTKQINEMYENDMDIDMEEGWLGDKLNQAGSAIGTGLSRMVHGTPEEWENKLRQHFSKMQKLADDRGVIFNMPVDDADWQNALIASRQLGDVDIVKRDGKWVPRMKGGFHAINNV